MNTVEPAPSALDTSSDVLIVGAGLSGIGAAYHIKSRCPQLTWSIVEARAAIGGTWDLFRYPGIRSDSDMHTFGYSFRPWPSDMAIADGPSIVAYIRETAATYGIDQAICFGQRVEAAAWSSADARWKVTLRDTANGATRTHTCRFLYLCTGYYDYAEGYTPDFPGRESFSGRIVHPQKWTPDVDYTGKRVVVIGSGATAVTLVPELAKTAAHVTMLQRSPTYIVSAPSRDRVAARLRRWLPASLAHAVTRWRNIFLSMGFYLFTRAMPRVAARTLVRWAMARLRGMEALEPDFTPRYNPWDQRLCLVPDADLFKAIRSGRASVVTDQIERFTPAGLRLATGRELEADLVVTATGLKMRIGSKIAMTVDGNNVDIAKTFVYRGAMASDVPNFAMAVGYTNASWTLKCDLTAAYVCRLLNHMSRRGFQVVTPRVGDQGERAGAARPLIHFSSGYIQRADGQLPRQGSRGPWRLHQNYLVDRLLTRYGRLHKDMEFR